VKRRRLGQWTLRFVVALSLLLCAAACAGWWRSEREPEAFYHVRWIDPDAGLRARVWILTNAGGTLGLEFASSDWRFNPPSLTRWPPGFHHVPQAAPTMTGARRSLWHRLGFGSAYTVTHDAFAHVERRRAALPYWFIATVAALLPLRQLVARLRRRRALRLGRCTACGYDLRGSPERCPECGAGAAAVVQRLGGIA
jgi:hypothetical protein